MAGRWRGTWPRGVGDTDVSVENVVIGKGQEGRCQRKARDTNHAIDTAPRAALRSCWPSAIERFGLKSTPGCNYCAAPLKSVPSVAIMIFLLVSACYEDGIEGAVSRDLQLNSSCL